MMHTLCVAKIKCSQPSKLYYGTWRPVWTSHYISRPIIDQSRFQSFYLGQKNWAGLDLETLALEYSLVWSLTQFLHSTLVHYSISTPPTIITTLMISLAFTYKR